MYVISYMFVAVVWVNRASCGRAVAFYAAIFFLVNLTYYQLIPDIFAEGTPSDVTPSMIRAILIRALCTLTAFRAAAVFSPLFPIGGMFLICLFIYLSPEAPSLLF
jgi:hypothetical protein